MHDHDADVIIIGAGIAGLACAEVLAAAGLSVIILEARDRVGGRILTHYDKKQHFPIELGAEFVHGEHPELIERIKRAGLRLRRINEEPWCLEEDGLQKCSEFWSQTEKVLEALRVTKKDHTFAEFLRSRVGKRFSADARDSATRYVEGFNAARAELISVNSIVRGLRMEEKINGDKQFRIVGGYAALVADVLKRLPAAQVRIETGTVVKQIRWKRGRVEAAVMRGRRRQTYAAQKAVVTLPLGVWQAGAVKFSPKLREKEAALKKLYMGEVIRVALRFRTRFWEKMRPQAGGATLRRMGFLFTKDKDFPTWWTQRPALEPLLIAWSPAWHTKRLRGKSNAAVVSSALASLARILGIPSSKLRKLLVEDYVHDWQADPFSRGAYSYVCAGGERGARALAAPVNHTLFFAGEATVSDGTSGTVHGALSSGTGAARELLKTIKT